MFVLLPSAPFSSAWAFECQRVLEDMRLVQLDPLSQTQKGRSAASVDDKAEAAKKKRITMMKTFLNTARLEKQRSFAILMVNYFIDEAGGQTGNLLDGMDLLMSSNDKKGRTPDIKPNNPTEEVLSYLLKTTSEDLNDVKGLTVYLLRAKNLKADPKKVLEFLVGQIHQGNQHFALLDKNCVVGDPTLDVLAQASM